MHFKATDPVRPLADAESNFLEVLLDSFVLTKHQGERGVRLEVQFDDDTPAIWNRRGRSLVRERMKARSTVIAPGYQARLNQILQEGKEGVFRPADSRFVWRWASAGALPIVRIRAKDYYCLFYRDIFPIGWNIANGACDNRGELRDPLQALEREVGEELVVLSPKSRARYVLRASATKNLDRPEFVNFRRMWHEQFPNLDIENYAVQELALGFEAGPDVVSVRTDGRTHRLSDCFVNINTADFGIELDRTARLALAEGAVLCDGETNENRILNRPVGLFEVEELRKRVARGQHRFVPDLFFHGGRRFAGSKFPDLLRRVVTPSVMQRSPDIAKAFAAAKNKLDLCPVTATLVRRHAAYLRDAGRPPASLSYDAFVSYHGPDKHLAELVAKFLSSEFQVPVFLADKALPRHPGFWLETVLAALNSSRCLISVGSESRYLTTAHVKFESLVFQQLQLDDPARRMIPLIRFPARQLPQPLCFHQAVGWRTDRRFNGALRELGAALRSSGTLS